MSSRNDTEPLGGRVQEIIAEARALPDADLDAAWKRGLDAFRG